MLKALSEGITDPVELRKIAGLHSVTEVYRTLDKMQIRKEYHEALSRADISLDFIVGKLKGLCDGEEVSDKIKLGAVQTLLKSLGLEKYDKPEESGKNWEEIVLEMIGKKNDGEVIEGEIGEYEVKIPALPEEIRKRQEEEKKAAEELYD